MLKSRPSRRLLRCLRRALDCMPPQERAVFDRARYDEMSDDEIAADLAIGADEVRKRLIAALAHLQRAVRATFGDTR